MRSLHYSVMCQTVLRHYKQCRTVCQNTTAPDWRFPFNPLFFVSLSYWQCHSSLTGHNIAWSPRQLGSSLLATFDSLGHISPPPIGDDLSYLIGMWWSSALRLSSDTLQIVKKIVGRNLVCAQLHGHVLPIRRCTNAAAYSSPADSPRVRARAMGRHQHPCWPLAALLRTVLTCSAAVPATNKGGHRHARIQRGHDTLLPLLHSG